MKRINTREVIVLIYDNVHAALWAGLAAFVIWFLLIIAPHIPEAQIKARSQRILEIMEENRFYCKKFKMPPGAPGHDQCMLDVQAFRDAVDRRIMDGMAF